MGFDDALTVAAGIQHRLTERLTIRGGYTFASSVLDDEEAISGVFAPLFYNHAVNCGASIKLRDYVSFDMAYTYFFESTLDGPILTAAGALPGSSISTSVSGHFASFGVGVSY